MARHQAEHVSLAARDSDATMDKPSRPESAGLSLSVKAGQSAPAHRCRGGAIAAAAYRWKAEVRVGYEEARPSRGRPSSCSAVPEQGVVVEQSRGRGAWHRAQ